MFSIKYVNFDDRYGYFQVFKDDKPWGIFGYPTEWDAIEELRETHPEEARDLEREWSEV